ncbi:MAG: TolC family protein, partial [Prevotellaceae bacterium]|nr:TolC family protein [Prevotellaceae bacterium]
MKKTIIIFLSGIFALQMSAQSVTKSLDECINAALENNLALKSGRLAVEKARVLQGTAFEIDKTQILLSQDPTSGGSTDNSIALSQSFDFPTIYAARHGALKAETELERSRLQLAENELRKEVASAYYQLLFAQENVRILQAQDSVCRKFLFLADAKLRAGETSRLEKINAERLLTENQMALQTAEQELQNGQFAMSRLLNINELILPYETELVAIETTLSAFDAAQTPTGNFYAN